MAATPPPAIKDGALGASMSRLARLGDAMVEHPAITLLAVWLLQMAYLGALQLAGLPFGFAVWPMGEDRNWLRFMQDGPGLSMMHRFWNMDDRNPLSPWWYWLFRWPIYNTDYGLYLVRKLVDPFLAISGAVLVRRLFRNEGGVLPLLFGLLILVCDFTAYRQQITWNFLGALGIALVATYWYLIYVDGHRTHGTRLGASMLLYLGAIATYTLEVGVLAIIAAIALFRRDESREPALLSRYRTRWIELACFAGMTGIFLAIWFTVSRTASVNYRLDFSLISHNALSSIRQFLWHPDFTFWIAAAIADHAAVKAALPMIVLLVTLGLVGIWRTVGGMSIKPSSLGWPLVLLVGIAAPIVALESMSNVWFPGSRTRMIYQVSAPLIGLLLLTLVSAIGENVRWRSATQVCAGIGFAVAVGLLLPASFEYNKQLNDRTVLQQRFALELGRLADEREDIRSFFVRYDTNPIVLWGSDTLSDTYAKTMLRRSDVSMRFIQTAPGPSGWTWWRLLIGPDDKGVQNATPGLRNWVPFRSLLFVRWDGERLTVPTIIDKDWFKGLQVDWNRSDPIIQEGLPKPECPASFDFSGPPPRGVGWSVPERRPQGGYAMWMSSQHASMRIRTACSGRIEVRLTVAGYMAEDIVTGLSLHVDRNLVRLVATHTPDGGLSLAGVANVAPTDDTLTIELDAPRTLVPLGGARNLAVMFSKISITNETSPAAGPNK